MKTYISQPKGSNSCGAYSIAYYLWESNKVENINDRVFVENIHKKIQFGSNFIGIPETYSNPEKMSNELINCWNSHANICALSDSPLKPIAESFNISAEIINIFDKVKSGSNKYAIIVCSLGNDISTLHYMLMKYESGIFLLLDSAYSKYHVVWEKFTLESSGKLALERNSNYCFTGVGILIQKLK
jgi:hypothetical protein